MITVKDIQDCPKIIYLKKGTIDSPSLSYKRILIGDTAKNEYTFYGDEKWAERAKQAIDRQTRVLNKLKTEHGVEPSKNPEHPYPSTLGYMANLIIIDDVVKKDFLG